jgi:HD-GYP domain-containing protein (c-di-GMP phosphodiesterase class II)
LSLILLIENNPKIESFYVLNLSIWLGLETIPKKRAEFAIKLLEKDPEVKLIITRSRIGEEDTASDILKHLQSMNYHIPVIVIGAGKKPQGSFAHIRNSLQLKPLIQNAARALNITAQEMSRKIVPDYFPIPVTYFNVLRRSVCPVYSQDIDDESKYNLRIQKLQVFEQELIDDMIREGVDNLYVDKMDRLEFVSNVTAELITELSQGDLSAEEAISAHEKSMELLSQKLIGLGINQETVELANKNLEVMQSQVVNYPQLAKLLDQLQSNEASYRYTHTQILTYVGMHIVRNIDWGTPEQQEKMAFISFFHDIALETDEQAKISHPLELKRANFPAPVKQLVERHAQIAAELVTKFPHAPMGADQLIRQHHGMLNGVGFSEHFGNNVSPMSIVFIIAEEFTRIILEREGSALNRNEMLKELRGKFPTSRFQKIIDLLQTITF